MPDRPVPEGIPSHPDRFVDRHVGPRPADVTAMLRAMGVDSLDALIDRSLPQAIRLRTPLPLPPPLSEREAMEELARLAGRNEVFRSYIGMGYHGTVLPPAIRRNILENPGWYTQYTPYQAEISQGRLEALLNFQTMVMELTGLPVANASLLDEATAAAEAMTLCRRVLDRSADGRVFFVSERCHPQTIAVVETRAEPLGIEVVIGDHETWDFSRPTFGALVPYPASDGEVFDCAPFVERAHAAGALVTIVADPLALALLREPGSFGADVCIGSAQRFGVPMGLGGPHAAFMATREEFKRQIPGRVVGVSKDAQGRPAIRLALQTREQHIRRDKATSNICTAQVLLAVIAATYAVYHGPEGLRAIARRVHAQTSALAAALAQLGHRVKTRVWFDTIRIAPKGGAQRDILTAAHARRMNLRAFPDGDLGIALDETVGEADLADLIAIFGSTGSPQAGSTGSPQVGSTGSPQVGSTGSPQSGSASSLVVSLSNQPQAAASASSPIPAAMARTSDFMPHAVFHRHRSETELLRYLKRLENKDLSLTQSMIPLGSCTMKLNAAAELFPISYDGFAALHPFAPAEQTAGYAELNRRLVTMLAAITGFDGVSLMPNAGAQGEYAGLLVIRAWHRSRGDAERTVCLIPVSAHGTNPASAIMAGMQVVPVACDANGNVDVGDLKKKIEAHRDRLGALMVTYPSTHGVFEEAVEEICAMVHAAGGQVYLDGANMNALVGLSRVADLGADVCHINLHKTFCIPHGGGGPGMGPICVARHLTEFLPGHPVVPTGGAQAIGPVSAAPFGSAGILPISFAYIAMMGYEGLKRATEIAILNANYIARRLASHYPTLYAGRNGFVAHECILDLRQLKASANIDPDDVAKRLMDYGFHAPTMSWPVAGTLMVEPTESESIEELDRFCEAMIAIRDEIREIEEGRADRAVNLLKMAPHTAEVVTADSWDRPYSRARAAFPNATVRRHKFWPATSRIDNSYGDRNLVCACPPIEAYAEVDG